MIMYGRDIALRIAPPEDDPGIGQIRVTLLVDGKERYSAYFTDKSEDERAAEIPDAFDRVADLLREEFYETLEDAAGAGESYDFEAMAHRIVQAITESGKS